MTDLSELTTATSCLSAMKDQAKIISENVNVINLKDDIPSLRNDITFIKLIAMRLILICELTFTCREIDDNRAILHDDLNIK